MSLVTLDEAQIRETAYLLWLDEGQPAGRDQEHWLKAINALTPAKPRRKPAARKAAAKPRAAKAAVKAAPKAAAKTKTAAKPKAKAKAAAK